MCVLFFIYQNQAFQCRTDSIQVEGRGRQDFLPSCRKVRSFLITGKRGMMGGCRFWLLRTLRYLAMFLEGSNRSWRSPNSFSYLLGSFSHVPRSLETGARFRPLNDHKQTARSIHCYQRLWSWSIHIVKPQCQVVIHRVVFDVFKKT